MTTIREIAAKSGYSPATVSRLLNDDPTFSISDTAKERILKTARNLNYYQNKSMKGPGFKVAVIFSVTPRKELEDAYYSNLRQNILTSGATANMVMTLFRDLNEVPNNIDGILAVGSFSKAELNKIKHLSGNIVFVDSNPDPHQFTSVQPNLEYITEHAIDLFRMAGRTTIGLISGKYWNVSTGTNPVGDVRRKYFESYMRQLNIFDNRLTFIGPDFSVESGYNLGMQVVQQLGRDWLPQGFLIGSDPLAVGVLQAFNENKITVPQDTAVISVNDLDIAKYVSPPLTTFKIDLLELGQVAIDTLREVITFPDTSHKTILLDSTLIVRKSFIPESEAEQPATNQKN
ncbi:transcription regulator [Agrilactobacillus composti DSM 18527 = JCM 14202]|uniref:Transcription regulator n=1 Tax=Agrilactobacillus composti DSM 18527 = JCM 14202 TaxID=1423734 RepID=A0A0R1XXI1_9LACO|nr:LacI family DNA-binding transcriptional regulator [Agrilactobacillus composti]KRM33412.1 transcription regulator [Agrilactobacillus composti DSM 18527 = JCM 14202]